VKKTSIMLRLPADKRKIIRTIAGEENRFLTDIFDQLADKYVTRHQETLELFSIPGFLQDCKDGIAEIKNDGGGSWKE
jgi:hypothetical protein